MKRLLAAAMAGFALILGATPAAANTVVRYPVPPAFPHKTHVHPCSFAWTITPVRTNQTETDFYDGAGTLVKSVITGDAIYNYTNDTTGKTLTLNNSAAQQIYYKADGSVTADISGPQVFVLPLLGIGGPATEWLVGGERTVYEISPTGSVSLLQKVGEFRDICQLLS